MRNRLQCGIQTTMYLDWAIVNDMYTALEYGQRIKLDYGMGTTTIKPRKGN